MSKGFTNAQITALCTTSPSSEAPAERPLSDQTENSSSTVDSDRTASPSEAKQTTAANTVVTDNANEQFLKTAIAAFDVSIVNNTLNYTRNQCVKYGEEDLFGFVPETCLDVKYKIGLNDLDVQKARKKYLIYGPVEIKVKGHIEREIIDIPELKRPSDRELILNKLDTGNETEIPIREGIPIKRVEEVFNKLVI